MDPLYTLQSISGLMIAAALLLIATTLLQALMLYRRQQRRQLRAQTHEMIKEDLRWRGQINDVLRSVKGRKISYSDLEEHPALQVKLRAVLDYCENICLGIRHGVYDEDTIKDSYAKLFVVLYAQVERLIHESRYESNNPETYGAFTSIVKRWQHDEMDGRKI